MKIIEKISKKQDFYNNQGATIAILGDSISHGCFECYMTGDRIETVYDVKSAYSTRLREMLNILFPSSQINIINSGISGDNAANGVTRMERDIFPYNPDLCIVSYQLNDACSGIENLELYKNSLREIFKKLQDRNIEPLFLTEGYLCKEASDLLPTQFEKDLAKSFSEIQNSGINKSFRNAAIEICKECNVKYIDFYDMWEKFDKSNVNFDFILANKLNHPIREFHYYMAMKIVEKMFED